MQVQAFEGYWENGTFYSLGQPVRATGRQRAILTLLDEPAREIKTSPSESRIEWLERLEKNNEKAVEEEIQARTEWLICLRQARQLAKDEPPPDFVIRQPMQEPHGLTD